MNALASDSVRLRQRAGSLRAVAATLERLPVRAALLATGPDTWTGPTPSAIHDELARTASALARGVSELHRMATRLEHEAGAIR